MYTSRTPRTPRTAHAQATNALHSVANARFMYSPRSWSLCDSYEHRGRERHGQIGLYRSKAATLPLIQLCFGIPKAPGPFRRRAVRLSFGQYPRASIWSSTYLKRWLLMWPCPGWRSDAHDNMMPRQLWACKLRSIRPSSADGMCSPTCRREIEHLGQPLQPLCKHQQPAAARQQRASKQHRFKPGCTRL